MKYAVTYIDFLRRPPYSIAPPMAQLAWHHLNAAASEEERAGAIPDCRGLEDRGWLTRAGITKSQVDDAVAAKLAVRRGNGLVIAGYSIERENAYKTNRANGQKGGRPSKTAENDTKEGNPRDNPPVNPGDNPRANPSPLPSSPLPSSASPSSQTEMVTAEPATARVPSASPSKRNGKAGTYSEAFERFWSVWTRKVAKDPAFAAWKTRGCEEQATMVTAAALAQKPFFESCPFDKRPHAASWINGRRWTDEVTPPRANGAAADVRVGHVRAEGHKHGGGIDHGF